MPLKFHTYSSKLLTNETYLGHEGGGKPCALRMAAPDKKPKLCHPDIKQQPTSHFTKVCQQTSSTKHKQWRM